MNFRALSRAVNVRAQLKRYMQRFGIWPLERSGFPYYNIVRACDYSFVTTAVKVMGKDYESVL
jgi:hypothetical protein